MIGHGIYDFYNIQDAVPDEDGLIESVLVSLGEIVVFPNMVLPLVLDRTADIAAIGAAQKLQETVIGVAQRDPDAVNVQPGDLYAIGVEMALGKMLQLPDIGSSVLAQGRRRVEIVEYIQAEPFFRVKARPILPDEEQQPQSATLMRATVSLLEKCVELNPQLPEEVYIYALNLDSPGALADLVASTLELVPAERQALLETFDPELRLTRVSELLGKELEVLELEETIQSQVRREVDRGQREMFLREQMRVIQHELGEGDTFQREVADLRDQIEQSSVSAEAREKALQELSRFSVMAPGSPEIGIIRTYLDWLLSLPWAEESTDNLDLAHASSILDAEHYGLVKAKNRILEYLAVRQLAPDKLQSPILCFVGPPGTGKTSLGKSVATALGREFVRVSLGGIHDEAEIRGHRRTYVGALPGRVIQTMRKCRTVNPVFMLDEIDKLGFDFRGDPASALLEVLDPEQNHAFSDHYLDVDYDLSKVFFITTANSLESIPYALLDRLEIIEFSGYVEEEKLSIARQFLIPRQVERHGLAGQPVQFQTSALRQIIREYTYEAGVRNLEREIAKVCRKLARRIVEGKSIQRRITRARVEDYLGPPIFLSPFGQEADEVGVANGLAWTEAGGDVMVIEVTLLPGKGMLLLTGQLGDVMQESAQAALSYARSRAGDFDLDPDEFERIDIHVHLPEGAIPKDGPSAGITLATALLSALTSRPVRRDVAMTGEITLRGRILPVGGVKEKVLTAHRSGIKKVLLPKQNIKDLVEISRRDLRGMEVVFVQHMDEVLAHALVSAEGDGSHVPESGR